MTTDMQYFAELNQRFDGAVELSFEEPVTWRPQPRECHKNVDEYCHRNPSCRPARGWLIRDRWTVIAHSVVDDPDRGLVDMTPPYGFQGNRSRKFLVASLPFFATRGN
jgi:hypothetical protein